MLFVDTLEFEGLGNRSYLAGGPSAAVVVDPPRDVDQVVAAAARRGVRIAYVAETHVHNDYITGGLELARLTGARYLVPAAATVTLDWSVVGPFAGAATLGAWDGKRLAGKVAGRRLQQMFAIALLAVAAFMLADALI